MPIKDGLRWDFFIKLKNGPISDFKNPVFRSHEGRFRPLKKFGKYGANFPNFPNFHIVESWKVGKLGKHAPAVATLVHRPLPNYSKGK